MNENDKVKKISWSEGLVDKNSEYVEITYQDKSDPVALIGKVDGTNFVVQFLINKDQPDNKKILKSVICDVDYYLIEKQEEDPWLYAKYHCTTPSNIYSSVHWSYVSEVNSDKSMT
jgi:hypothetical protein